MKKTTIILDDEQVVALSRCRRFEKRTMKAVIENAIDDYFRRLGRRSDYRAWLEGEEDTVEV